MFALDFECVQAIYHPAIVKQRNLKKLYSFRNSFLSIFNDLRKHWLVGAYYMVPASLYCLYNNLAFTNLANFDPTTYFVFMQIRLLMTGLIYQVFFSLILQVNAFIVLL